MSELSNLLLKWYDRHRRDLPWRGTADPYRVWLSEIMLQQTRVETVAGYYDRFLSRFPTVGDLARAETDEVLKLWEGLGYYSRARCLHAAAKAVALDRGGRFPETAAELKKLPGIGPYAANAVASIAFGQPVPALDGNQARILTRVLAWDAPLKTPFDLEAPAMEFMDFQRPGDYNQALMDLGSAICMPKAPKCNQCPLKSLCAAAREGDPESFPRKKPPIIRQESEWTVAVVRCGGRVAVRRRPSGGLLGGLYEFPMLEGRLSPDALQSALTDAGFENVRVLRPLPPSRHVFTHRIWRMVGASAAADGVPDGWMLVSDFTETAIPSALRVYREAAEDLLNENSEWRNIK